MKLKYRIWNETENRYLTPDEATVTPDGRIVGWDGAKDDCVVEVWTRCGPVILIRTGRIFMRAISYQTEYKSTLSGGMRWGNGWLTKTRLR
jgi:hypothetical protein